MQGAIQDTTTLDAVDARGLLADIGTLHLDRGCAELGVDDSRRREETRTRQDQDRRDQTGVARDALARRTDELLNVELRALRRNTDRFIHHRLDQITLAVTVVTTVKLVKRADRWNPAN